MKLMIDERVLVQYPGIVLTSHRVRSMSQNSESKNVTSIMLDELASCGVDRRSKPVFLVLAVACFLFGIYGSSVDNRPVAGFGFLLAAAFLVVYLATLQQVLSLASAGDSIRIRIQYLNANDAMEFVDAVEEAKNARYLLRKNI